MIGQTLSIPSPFPTLDLLLASGRLWGPRLVPSLSSFPPGWAARRIDRNLSGSIPKQILQFGKDRAISASQVGGEISLLVDAVRLPVVVIVAEIDRSAGVDAVG